jgi:hypothetical protein
MHTNFQLEYMKERDHMIDAGIDGKVMLVCLLLYLCVVLFDPVR